MCLRALLCNRPRVIPCAADPLLTLLRAQRGARQDERAHHLACATVQGWSRQSGSDDNWQPHGRQAPRLKGQGQQAGCGASWWATNLIAAWAHSPARRSTQCAPIASIAVTLNGKTLRPGSLESISGGAGSNVRFLNVDKVSPGSPSAPLGEGAARDASAVVTLDIAPLCTRLQDGMPLVLDIEQPGMLLRIAQLYSPAATALVPWLEFMVTYSQLPALPLGGVMGASFPPLQRDSWQK